MTNVFKPDQTRYELDCKLGEGLNSNVWRATRFDFSGENPRVTALKLPKDQNAVPFLRREYEILQRVNSPHVVRVIAWESFDTQPALALEWIDGVTLDHLAKTRTLTLAHRDELARQIHIALKDVHSAGACHGDLHPGNIMIDREGRVVLIDFASGKTPEGLLQATPAFVAPEIWEGASFSHEADLFALKVIREHMLSGFRDLPKRSSAPRDFKIAKPAPQARKELATDVAEILGQGRSSGTQLLAIDISADELDAELDATLSRRSLKNPHPHFMRAVCAIAVVLTLHIPVFADDPAPEAPGSGKIFVTSRKWMQIKLNGDEAGFAPIKLQNLKSGKQHLEWKSATRAGEFHFKMNAGDTVRLTENLRGELVVVPLKPAR